MAETYQLHIVLDEAVERTIGRLGTFSFPAGRYVYTGSARRNIEARVARHRASTKKLRWHIDHLLADPHAHVVDVTLSTRPECEANQRVAGEIVVAGFGSSDCRSGCRSHLKRQGSA